MRVLHTAGGHKGEVRSIRCVSGDDRLLVSTSSDHTAIVWQISAEVGPQVKCVLSGHSAPVSVACALKRREGDLLVATTSNDQDVRIWTVNTESCGIYCLLLTIYNILKHNTLLHLYRSSLCSDH